MPIKVPSYDGPQIAERGLPSARQDTAASPVLLGAGAEGMKTLGAGLLKGGDALVEVAAKIQERENVDMVFRAETALRDDLLKFDTEQRSKKGAAALTDGGITAQGEKWFGETTQRHLGVLKNDNQRRAFGRIAEKLRLETLDTHSKHQAVQAAVSVTQSANAAITGAINRAAANSNDWTVAEAEAANIRTRVAVLAQVNGYTPEVRDAELGKQLTMLHKQVLQQLVVSNPAAAKTYFEKYQDQIDGGDRAEIGQFAAKATATSLGDGAADAIWNADGPKSRTDPVTLDTMETKLRAALKGNDDAIEKGIKGLRERAAAYRDQRKEEATALEASVNGLILQGASTAQLRKSPEFLRLSVQAPEDARKILTFLENQSAARESRAAAAESRAYTRERRAADRLTQQGWATALELSDPDALVRKSRNELINLLPDLGAEHVSRLVAKHDALTKNPEKLTEARMDKQSFDSVADSMGLGPYDPTKTEPQRRQLGLLQDRVEQVIGREQAAAKRVLTRQEEEAVMRRELSSALVGVGRLWDTPTPAILVSPQDYGKVTVPKTDREAIITALKKRNLPATDRDVVHWYLRGQAQGKWVP